MTWPKLTRPLSLYSPARLRTLLERHDQVGEVRRRRAEENSHPAKKTLVVALISRDLRLDLLKVQVNVVPRIHKILGGQSGIAF